MLKNQKSKNREVCKKAKSSSEVVVLKQGTSNMRFNSFGKDGCGY